MISDQRSVLLLHLPDGFDQLQGMVAPVAGTLANLSGSWGASYIHPGMNWNC